MLMKSPSTSEIVEDHVSALTQPLSPSQDTSIGGWLAVIGRWMERSRQREALADLEDHLLDDIGVSRRAAAQEIAKPFWR